MNETIRKLEEVYRMAKDRQDIKTMENIVIKLADLAKFQAEGDVIFSLSEDKFHEACDLAMDYEIDDEYCDECCDEVKYYESKVNLEIEELDIKILNLSEFLDSDNAPISGTQYGLLETQLLIMKSYANILSLRLEDMMDSGN